MLNISGQKIVQIPALQQSFSKKLVRQANE